MRHRSRFSRQRAAPLPGMADACAADVAQDRAAVLGLGAGLQGTYADRIADPLDLAQADNARTTYTRQWRAFACPSTPESSR